MARNAKLVAPREAKRAARSILTARLNHIEQQLSQPMIDALDAEFAKPEELLEKLNALHTAWFNL